ASPRPVFSRMAPGGVLDLAATPGGNGVLVATRGGGQIWRLTADQTALRRQTSIRAPTTAAAAARNGSYAFAVRRGVYLWDAVRERFRYLRVPGGVNSLAFGGGGSVLVAGGGDSNVVTWDVASGRSFGPPRPAGGDIEDVAISPDGKTI